MSFAGSLVARYPMNVAGRDFVVGDIHGAYTLLLSAMKNAGFDPNVDRLFSVGDLIDRGEESARVARFLAQPYVYAVRGNHEDMLIEMADSEFFPEYLIRQNRMEWWTKATDQEKADIITAIRKLPVVIEVDTPRGVVGIVHAEVPAGMSWQDFMVQIELGNETVTENALWGRGRIERNDQSGVPGVGRVFVGHTPQKGGANRFGNVYAVDTGAIFADMNKDGGAWLTLTNLITSTVCFGKPENPVNGFVVLDEPIDRKFGNYGKRIS